MRRAWEGAGRVTLYAGLCWLSWTSMTTPLGPRFQQNFLHMINLPFHEAGHVFCRPFGRFVHLLGGTLGQLVMPLVCLIAFLRGHNPFGASVALWWFGENFLDIAPYINDARELQLVLPGDLTGQEVPDYHDWQQILGTLGWLQYDHAMARASYSVGLLLMGTALLFGGRLLVDQGPSYRGGTSVSMDGHDSGEPPA